MKGTVRTALISIAALAAMTGLVAASVPLYSLFCKVTGAGGTPRVATGPSPARGAQMIEIRFDGAVMKDMPWRFLPAQKSMSVHLGETNLAAFTAENLSQDTLTGTAVFNVMPAKAGPYVDKIQCFCFSEQRLGPGEKAELPVSFYIDPAIATDPDTSDVHTITLSYTFFKARQQPAAKRAAGGPTSEGRS
ncbi:cytochrome c oxidase assembly protein [Telmatospirillum siberiense]|uniref:Cytochrome c oxidase assembly protein CtaG n=1 Tax=Telmatospirillum siberiense TaxID=382514 RepID=A0A2N3PR21_9PROT|nr:cytochrome c oxidase assembly protein [Telmatospirillum siberiense]PKU22847.1 cytochrome c oxidase assembly protein [Telmatospirillum siberiense]